MRAAREEARTQGDSRRAPPQPLEDCREEIVRSALAGPQTGFGDFERYPSLAAKAAVLAYRFAKGHACGDGNKRLALILTVAFLEANGLDLDAEPEETEHVFRHVAASEAAVADQVMEDLRGWFERATRPLHEEG